MPYQSSSAASDVSLAPVASRIIRSMQPSAARAETAEWVAEKERSGRLAALLRFVHLGSQVSGRARSRSPRRRSRRVPRWPREAGADAHRGTNAGAAALLDPAQRRSPLAPGSERPRFLVFVKPGVSWCTLETHLGREARGVSGSSLPLRGEARRQMADGPCRAPRRGSWGDLMPASRRELCVLRSIMRPRAHRERRLPDVRRRSERPLPRAVRWAHRRQLCLATAARGVQALTGGAYAAWIPARTARRREQSPAVCDRRGTSARSRFITPVRRSARALEREFRRSEHFGAPRRLAFSARDVLRRLDE